MYYLVKTQLLFLVITLSLLSGFTLYPPFSSAGIDLNETAADPAGADRALMVGQNSTQRLIGTAVSMKNPADSYAVIEDVRDGRQWIYREGEAVGAVLIKQILPDRIIVTGGDNEKEIKLRSSLAGVAAAGILTTTGQVILPAAAPTTNLAGSRYRQYLVDASEVAAAFAEPKRLLDSVSMHYVDRTPRNTGVRIGSFGPESVFASMGLRTGDLLLSVNDQSVTGTDDALTKLQAMLDDGQAELKVRRRARTYRFHLQAE